eukprot:GFYU01011931.1.p1 GENE.GFYU01011931.1~~GFYU01011931.1.p1  ORF type:complete len:1188 (+),score=358.40 GFYU01011931.1:24-3587(+)
MSVSRSASVARSSLRGEVPPTERAYRHTLWCIYSPLYESGQVDFESWRQAQGDTSVTDKEDRYLREGAVILPADPGLVVQLNGVIIAEVQAVSKSTPYGQALVSMAKFMSDEFLEVAKGGGLTTNELMRMFYYMLKDAMHEHPSGFSPARFDMCMREFDQLLANTLEYPNLTEWAKQREASQTLQNIHRVFGVPDSVHETITADAATRWEQCLLKELRGRLFIIPNHQYYYKEAFASVQHYETWTKLETEQTQDYLSRLFKHEVTTQEINNRHMEVNNKTKEVVGMMNIQVVGARGLVSKSKGTSNPMCEVIVGKKHRKTSVEEKTLNPTWQCDMAFKVWDKSEDIRVYVWNKDKFVDDFMGKFALPLRDFDDFRQYDDWYPLLTRKSSRIKYKVSGEVHLRIQFIPNQKYVDNQVVMHEIEENTQACEDHHLLYKMLLHGLLMQENPNSNMNELAPELQIIAGGRRPSETQMWKDREISPLSDGANKLLQVFADVYGIRPIHRGLMFFEAIVHSFEHTTNYLKMLKTALSGLVREISQSPIKMTVNETIMFKTSSDILMHYCKKRISKYKHIFPRNMPEDGLKTLLEIFTMTVSNQLSTKTAADIIKDCLQDALRLNYERFLMKCQDDADTTASQLTAVGELIQKEFEYDMLYYRKCFSACSVDIGDIEINVYSELYSRHLEKFFASRPVSEIDHMTFDLYSTVLRLNAAFAKRLMRKTNLVDKVPVSRYVNPSVQSYIKQYHDQLKTWMPSACRQDNLDPISETVLYSSSVIDLFTMFNNLLKFIRDLGWERGSQFYATFMLLTGEVISSALSDYIRYWVTSVSQAKVIDTADAPTTPRGPEVTKPPAVTTVPSSPVAASSPTGQGPSGPLPPLVLSVITRRQISALVNNMFELSVKLDGLIEQMKIDIEDFLGLEAGDRSSVSIDSEDVEEAFARSFELINKTRHEFISKLLQKERDFLGRTTVSSFLIPDGDQATTQATESVSVWKKLFQGGRRSTDGQSADTIAACEEFLDDSIGELKENLADRSFKVVLKQLFMNVLERMEDVILAKYSHAEIMNRSHCIDTSLQRLTHFFHGDGMGLPEGFMDVTVSSLTSRLRYDNNSTIDLIEMYTSASTEKEKMNIMRVISRRGGGVGNDVDIEADEFLQYQKQMDYYQTLRVEEQAEAEGNAAGGVERLSLQDPLP